MQINIFDGSCTSNWIDWIFFQFIFKLKQHKNASITNIVYYVKTLFKNLSDFR